MPKCEHGLTSRECYVCASPKMYVPKAQQEPVAWMNPETSEVITVARHAAWERDYGLAAKGVASKFTVPLYATPPQREPLTDEEIHARYDALRGLNRLRYIEIYRDAERAHGITKD